MKLKNLFFYVFFVACLGCSKSEITLQPVSDDANLAGTTALPFTPGASIKKMEGIYALSNGSKGLGTQFVCKVSKNKVSFFSDAAGIFIILKYGYKASDGSIQFSGFWRVSEKPDQGNIHFSISSAEGAAALLAGTISYNAVTV